MFCFWVRLYAGPPILCMAQLRSLTPAYRTSIRMSTYLNPFEKFPQRKRMPCKSSRPKRENSQIRSEPRSCKTLDLKPNIVGRYYSKSRKGRDDMRYCLQNLHTIFTIAVLGSRDSMERR